MMGFARAQPILQAPPIPRRCRTCMLTPQRPISPPQGAGMAYVVAVLIALFGGWWVAATDALFRASERPGVFARTSGMVLLLFATAGGGLLLAGGAIWI